MFHVFFVSLKFLLERKRQSSVSVLGVSIGVAAFVVMSSLMLGFQKHFVKQVIDLDAHVSLKPREVYDEGRVLRGIYKDAVIEVLGSKPKEIRETIRDYREIIQRFTGRYGILGVSPHLNGSAILRFGSREKTVKLFGIEPELEAKATSIGRYVEREGIRRLKENRRGIILGKLVARDLGVKRRGQKVILVSSKGVAEVFEVVDFFNSNITTIDQSRAYVHIKAMQRLTDTPDGVNELVFRLRDVNDAVKVARAVERETGYRAQSWQEAYSNFLQLFKIQRIITFLVVGAILLVSAFGIFNILMMTVLEKKRDIAILKAIGFSERDITLVFLLQGLVVGILGSLLGAVGAFLAQEYLANLELDLEGILRAKGFILDRSNLYYLLAFLFATLMSLSASIYPAWRAARLNPVDIFRSAGV